MKKAPAPLYVDATALCQWLLEHFDHADSVLGRELCRQSLVLLDTLCLALKGFKRPERIAAADESLVKLRAKLRLAQQIGLLTQAQMLFALESADLIGRQLGGWARSQAGAAPRRRASHPESQGSTTRCPAQP